MPGNANTHKYILYTRRQVDLVDFKLYINVYKYIIYYNIYNLNQYPTIECAN